jgi:hypothetical protein
MTNLSPATQAVKDAAQKLYADRMARKMAWPLDLPVVAAALRAAADQVVPRELFSITSNKPLPPKQLTKSIDQYCQRQQTRQKLLAIAAELENQ